MKLKKKMSSGVGGDAGAIADAFAYGGKYASPDGSPLRRIDSVQLWRIDSVQIDADAIADAYYSSPPGGSPLRRLHSVELAESHTL